MNISVVIPIFNELESLPELKSELIQNLKIYKNWEVIFIDDGSSDSSMEIIQKYKSIKKLYQYCKKIY